MFERSDLLLNGYDLLSDRGKGSAILVEENVSFLLFEWPTPFCGPSEEF